MFISSKILVQMLIIGFTIWAGIFVVKSSIVERVFGLAQQGCLAVVVVMQGFFEKVRCMFELEPGQVSGRDGNTGNETGRADDHTGGKSGLDHRTGKCLVSGAAALYGLNKCRSAGCSRCHESQGHRVN